MGDIFGAFQSVKPESRNKSFDDINAYEEHYMKLLKNYSNEISQIEQMMKDLRDERINFYTKQLPEIQKAMDKDEVLSEENKSDWLKVLQENMEKSFEISEALINHYVTKNLEEFKRELRKAACEV